MPKHHLLIGGSSGIGLATARSLLAAGDHITAACRNAGPLAHLGVPVFPFDALAPELDPAGWTGWFISPARSPSSRSIA